MILRRGKGGVWLSCSRNSDGGGFIYPSGCTVLAIHTKINVFSLFV